MNTTLFTGGGQMGELLRSYNWNDHPLGEPGQWPASLQTGIRMMLQSGYPMFIWWSRELYMFHNDAFAPTFVGRHAQVLGAKAREVWKDVWGQLGGVVEEILEKGTTFYAEDMRVVPERKGFKEETYWTFSYSPMPDNEGNVNGIFCACSDVTQKVLSQRRLHTLHQLSEESLVFQHVEQACEHTLGVLEKSPSDLPFAALYLLDETTKALVLKGQTGLSQPLPQRIELAAFSPEFPPSAVLPPAGVSSAEQGINPERTAADFFRQETYPEQIAQFLRQHLHNEPVHWFTAEASTTIGKPDAFSSRGIVLPLEGQQGIVGFLLAGVSPMLEYDQEYKRFHQLLAGKLASTIEGVVLREQQQRQAQAEQARLEAERNRLYSVFEQAPVAITLLEGASYVIRLANPIICQLWGRTGEQVLNKPLFEALPEIRNQGLDELLEGVRTTGKPYVGQELPLELARQGKQQVVYFNFVYHPIRDEQGTITRIAVVATDVSELVFSRQKVEESAGKLQILNEELTTANQETTAANEELLAAQEELRAGYEELQASNEELSLARQRLEGLNAKLEERVGERTQQLQQARQQAEKQREEIYQLFMQAPAGIALLEGPELIYRMANETYCQILGRDEQILGKPGRVAFPEGVEQGIWDLLDSLYASGKAYVGKDYRACIDMEGTGALSEQYYDFVFQPVKGNNQQVTGILITALNVTHQVIARKAVLEREAYFRQMADGVPVMIWVTRPDGLCTYLNKPWYQYTGQTEQEALGLGWLEATHPEDKPRREQVFQAANQQQAPFSLLYRLRGREGTYRWFLDKGEPKFDPSGHYEGHIGVVIDVHEQHLAEERLQLSVKAGRVGIWEWDVVRDRARYSDLLLELFGLEPEKYQVEFANAYQVFQSVIYPPDWELVNSQVEQAFANQAKEFYVEFRVQKPSGEIIWIAERGEVVYEGQKPVRMNGTCIDITYRKKAEQQTQQLSEELAAVNEELAAANEELRAANEEIQAANEELSQTNGQLTSINADLDNFVYSASHDLKSPILNIEGLLKALKRQLAGQALHNQNIEQIYELLYSSVDRFKKTIGDLTEVARISKESQEDVSRINLSEVLNEVLQDLEPQILEAGALIEQHLDCRKIFFSRKNLKSLLYNLVSNAVKYRSPDRQPLIRITCSQETDHPVLIVGDNGLGFDMRQQDKVFGLFKRLHNHVEGTGIGLYIVKKMVENAGGRIEVKSQIDVGSTFRVHFSPIR